MRFPFVVFSLLFLVSISSFGIFHYCILSHFEEYISFYISISSCFLFFITYLLLIKFISDDNINFAKNYTDGFVKTVMKSDSNFISFEELSSIRSKFLDLIIKTSGYNTNLFCSIFPCFTAFLTTFLMICLSNFKIGIITIIAISMTHIVLILLNFVNRMTELLPLESSTDSFCRKALNIARGGQFFNIGTYLYEKINQDLHNIYTSMHSTIARKTWKMFFLMCLTFCIFLLVYIFLDSSFSQGLFFELQKYSLPLTFCLSSYTFAIVSLYKLKELSKNIEDIDTLLNDIPCLMVPSGKTSLDKTKDLFIAFHGICFHKNGTEILNNVTFSILPGEVIVITGENIKKSSYIFDLILKFYKPQSGNIYIAGNNIDIINTNNLRSYFAIFKIDFGLINGSIEENIRLAAESSEEKLLKILDKVGLFELSDELVLGPNDDILVSQEILIRIQMARIFMRKQKIILIEEPESFENPENEELFFDFVKFIAKRRTVIISTKDSASIVYADKVLYMGMENTIFGTHAELSTKPEYRNFLAKFCEKNQ